MSLNPLTWGKSIKEFFTGKAAAPAVEAPKTEVAPVVEAAPAAPAVEAAKPAAPAVG